MGKKEKERKKLQEKRDKQEEATEVKKQERLKDFEAPEENSYENKLVTKEKSHKKDQEAQKRRKKKRKIRRGQSIMMTMKKVLALKNETTNFCIVTISNSISNSICSI